MDHGPPGSSVHRILQARILEWVAISFSRDKVWSEWSEVAQLCPTLWDPMDCSLPGSSIHGIFQVRIVEWVAISFSRFQVVWRFFFNVLKILLKELDHFHKVTVICYKWFLIYYNVTKESANWHLESAIGFIIYGSLKIGLRFSLIFSYTEILVKLSNFYWSLVLICFSLKPNI